MLKNPPENCELQRQPFNQRVRRRRRRVTVCWAAPKMFHLAPQGRRRFWCQVMEGEGWMEKKSSWYPKQPFFNGCLVKQPLFYVMICLEFQVGRLYPIIRRVFWIPGGMHLFYSWWFFNQPIWNIYAEVKLDFLLPQFLGWKWQIFETTT